jgi:outer membrane protein assembly factor BamA
MTKLLLSIILTLGLFGSDFLDSLKEKPKMSQTDIDEKREGGYITGLPLVNSDADLGVGYGLRLFYFDNQTKEDALFEYTPYRHQLFAQYFQTTNGWQYHELYYDAPYIFDSPFRLNIDAVIEQNDKEPYFGDNDTIQSELVLEDEIDLYNYYQLFRPFVKTTLQYDLTPVTRVIGGFNFMYSDIDIYQYSLVWCNQPNGVQGGLVNSVLLGLAYDTRDFAPDPKKGQFHEILLDYITPLLGSEYDYNNTILRTRFYHSILNDQITFGMQNLYHRIDGEAPFFELPYLGGRTTLRGYTLKRFQADEKFQTNLESRIRFAKTSLGSQLFEFMIVPFYDIGTLDFEKSYSSYGAGLRVVWNKATIIYADYGKSDEGSGLYINFTHIFQAAI